MGRMGGMVGCCRKWGEDGNEAEETGATMEEKGKENSLKINHMPRRIDMTCWDMKTKATFVRIAKPKKNTLGGVIL